ncbi:MAG: energy transducer TonB [Thermotogae bacterium]|nr:energy transducer TonB [Thermotogota bacterium]
MAKDRKSFIKKIFLESELEEEYTRDLNLAFTVALLIFIGAFLFGKGCKLENYSPKKKSETVIEQIELQTEFEEPPPPPPKPKVSLPEEIEEVESEAEQDTIDIAETTEFSEEDLPAPPTDTLVREVFEVDEPPEPVVNVQPEYPDIARQAGLEGKVLVEAVIDENGNVVDARIKYSSNEIFNEAALAAMRKMKFKPAKQKGIPVKVRIIQPFIFKLRR